jgi:hypothetical protein
VGEKPAALQLTDGEVRFTQGNFAHAAINKSDRPFHNITIELLKPASHVSNCADACEISPPCAAQPKSACPATEKRISSDQWTVSMVTLPPSASLSKNANGPPQLLIAVSYIVLLRTAGTSGTNVMGTPGKLEWVPGGASPAFTNNGMKPVQFVTLEFNPEKQSQ